MMRDRFAPLNFRFADDPFRRNLERPRENHRCGKSERYQDNQDFHYPWRRIKGRKQNRRRLNQEPRNDQISDRNLVNIAPLQLGEKRRLFAHYGPMCSFIVSSCRKPGSFRIGSHAGFIFRLIKETSWPAGMASKRRRISIAPLASPVRALITARLYKV